MSSSRAVLLRQTIRKQVMTEYEPALEQAIGWQKRYIRWKINFITQVRYRGIFTLGGPSKI